MKTTKRYGVRCELFVEKLRFIARFEPREQYLFPMLDSGIFQDAMTSMDAVIEAYEDEHEGVVVTPPPH